MVSIQRWWWLGIVLVIGWLVYLLSPILTPFLLAAMFAYLGDPLVDWLESKKLSRTLSVILVFVVLTLFGLLVLLMMIPMLKHQFELVARNMPVVLTWVKAEALPFIAEKSGTDSSDFDVAAIEQTIREQITGNTGLIATVLQSLTRSGLALFGWLANLVLIPVVTFYLLRDWDELVAKVAALLPRKTEPVAVKLAEECDEVLSAFVRGQLMVMVALGLIYAVGLWIVGIDLALLVGVVAGLASIVPYLGFIIGIVFATVAALVQFGDPQILIWVALVFCIGQMLEGMVLTPLLVGDKIGLHPVAVIFAILAGGQLFGFIGILLALPVAAVIMVLLRHAHDKYLASIFYDNDEVNAKSDGTQLTVETASVSLSDESVVERASNQTTKSESKENFND